LFIDNLKGVFMDSFIYGVLSGVFVNHIFPFIGRSIEWIISNLLYFVDKNRVNLNGTWEQVFTEPASKKSAKWKVAKEKVELRHFGSSLSGKGITKKDKRVFEYKCKVQHSMVFGSYKKKTAAQGNITGNGMIQLMITPDRTGMIGQATWYDKDTEKIESSKSTWTKIT
jgi:hypothetical protein